MNNDDSDTETRNEKKPPKCRKPKNDLIKIKKKASKKPKAEFDSLTFVEEHQDTFYIGLNENINGVQNPMHAREVNIDEAEDLAKDWVKPDSQLVQRGKFINNRRRLADQIVEEFKPSKIKPLSFLNEPLELSVENEIDSPITNRIPKLSDLLNGTEINEKDITLMSPSRYKIYVADTPDIYKGLSIIERRMKGLKF